MTQLVPAGSFVRNQEDDGFLFTSSPPGIRHMDIRDNGVFRVRATGLDLAGIDLTSPVTFGLRIGDDEGKSEITLDERLRYR